MFTKGGGLIGWFTMLSWFTTITISQIEMSFSRHGAWDSFSLVSKQLVYSHQSTWTGDHYSQFIFFSLGDGIARSPMLENITACTCVFMFMFTDNVRLRLTTNHALGEGFDLACIMMANRDQNNGRRRDVYFTLVSFGKWFIIITWS